VKGFPLLLRISGDGKQVMPDLSMFEEIGEVAVILKPEGGDDPREYRIESTRGQDRVLQTPDGEQVDGARMFRTVVPKGQRRAMLLDLSSLRPEIGKGLTLAEVPPGKYRMQIEYRHTSARSEPVALELLAASNKEDAFLKQSLVEAETGLRRRWPWLLRQRRSIPAPGANGLSEVAMQQLQFHLLVSKATAAPKATEALFEQLRVMPVPEYLEAERQVLLFDVALAAKLDGASEARKQELEKTYPELKWRLDQIRDSGASFLRFAKYATEGNPGEK